MKHACSYPAHQAVIGTVWVCNTCGLVWECLPQFRGQTHAGPEWINPGKWASISDTKAPPWAIAEQRDVRRKRKTEELAW